MDVLRYRTDPHDFELDVRCPHCRQSVAARPVSPATYKISEVSDETAYLICQCPRQACQAVIFVEYDRLNNRVTRIHPRPDVVAANYRKAIPEAVRADFAEAVRCHLAEAYKGVVVLCRRAMQTMMIDKGATKEKLQDQIEEIYGRGLIIEPLQKAAHEVRHFGNFGSHPRDDGLDDIAEGDADLVLRITQNFMNALYVQPAEVEQLQQKRRPSEAGQ